MPRSLKQKSRRRGPSDSHEHFRNVHDSERLDPRNMSFFKPISELRRETAALGGSNRLDRHRDSDRRRGEADKRREPSRSRPQEPEQPVNGAND